MSSRDALILLKYLQRDKGVVVGDDVAEVGIYYRSPQIYDGTLISWA